MIVVCEAKIVNKQGRPRKLALVKVWFVRRVYRMRRKFGNHWMECNGLDGPSTMR